MLAACWFAAGRTADGRRGPQYPGHHAEPASRAASGAARVELLRRRRRQPDGARSAIADGVEAGLRLLAFGTRLTCMHVPRTEAFRP